MWTCLGPTNQEKQQVCRWPHAHQIKGRNLGLGLWIAISPADSGRCEIHLLAKLRGHQCVLLSTWAWQRHRSRQIRHQQTAASHSSAIAYLDSSNLGYSSTQPLASVTGTAGGSSAFVFFTLLVLSGVLGAQFCALASSGIALRLGAIKVCGLVVYLGQVQVLTRP